jgi:uncharacterized membrane protein
LKSHSHSPKNNALTTVGVLLWRGGVYFCAGYLAFHAFRLLLSILWEIALPTQIQFSIFLIGGGMVLILFSLILERVQDAKSERGLKD